MKVRELERDVVIFCLLFWAVLVLELIADHAVAPLEAVGAAALLAVGVAVAVREGRRFRQELPGGEH